MMDEYIQTLRIRALQGDQNAAVELEKALAHRTATTESTQRFASDLRAQGKDVTYRPDGGIEFALGDREPPPTPQPDSKPQSKPMAIKQSHKKEEYSDWLQHVPTLFLWVFVAALLVGIVIAVSLNTIPFIEMSSIILGGNADSLPVIGWFIGGVKIGAAFFMGVAWYAIFQLLEIAPTIMTASDKKTLAMINSATNRVGVQINTADSVEVRWLKNQYNMRPIASLQFFRRCRWPIRLTELAVCWYIRPPIQGGLGDFITVLATGQFYRINPGNVLLTVSVIFLVDWLLKVLLHVIGHIHADRQQAKAVGEREG